MNGLGLQKELEARGGCEQIIFITGHKDVATCTQAMKNGAVDFLLKPFDSDELIEAVWLEAPPAADSALYALVSKLRRVIGSQRVEGRRELPSTQESPARRDG